MKKFVLFALVLVLAFAMVSATLQAPVSGGDAYAAKVCPNVGWNTRGACIANNTDAPVQPVAALARPPVGTPDVGWNT